MEREAGEEREMHRKSIFIPGNNEVPLQADQLQAY